MLACHNCALTAELVIRQPQYVNWVWARRPTRQHTPHT